MARKLSEEERKRREEEERRRALEGQRLGTEERGTAIEQPPLQPITRKTFTPGTLEKVGGFEEKPITDKELLELPKMEIPPAPKDFVGTPPPEKTPRGGADEIFTNRKGDVTGIVRNGKFFEVNAEEAAELVGRAQARKEIPEGAVSAVELGKQERLAREGAVLAGQVGQIQPTTGVTPTAIDYGEAASVAVREGIPRALTIAGAAALTGAGVGAVAGGGAASVPLALAGAAAGFMGSISASMLGSIKGQRIDTTTAQQRVLDEGKQNMQEAATQAAADPSNRVTYLAAFNAQKQVIQNAHVEMLTDTNADVLKFETALPNLAEFNAFYGPGGELFLLEQDMQRALRGEIPPLEINFRMLALANKYGDTPQININQDPGFLGSLIP